MIDRSVSAMRRVGLLTAAVGAAMSTGVAAAGDDFNPHDVCASHSAMDAVQDRAFSLIESSVLATFTPEQRRTITLHELGMYDPQGVGLPPVLPALTGTDYDRVAHLISPAAWERATEGHRQMLLNAYETGTQTPGELALCFAPGTDPELVMAVDQALYGPNPIAFQIQGRWSFTATNGNTGNQGTNITLTYGFPADGSFVPDQGFGGGGSQFNAWMNGIYGNQSVWQPLYDEVFERWGELIGVTYVYEPNDDGVSLSNSNPGVLGVRADVRIGAISLDGNGGVLAYNNFPNHGDMIFDAFDSFYNSTGGNSLRLRNVIWHEHGHGLGMAHVCPANGTKLMEPFLSTAFVGPQLDDILNGQRNYGDLLEPNDTIGQATDLGDTSSGVTIEQISIDDNSDTDVFEFSISEQRRLLVSVVPVGATYLEGPQTQACNSGSTFDSLRIHDLTVTVFNSSGSPIAIVNNAGIGQAEEVDLNLENPGTYYISVTGDATNNIQLYNITVSDLELPFIPLDLTETSGFPEAVDPGVVTPISVTVSPNDETVVGGQLRYRTGSAGAFASVPLSASGNVYTATLPAFLCEDNQVQYFVEVEGDMSGVLTLPEDGASNPVSAMIGEIAIAFEDNFQTNKGWTVTSTASDGQWTRGVPAGDGSRSDPTTDGDGSGSAYLTDNVPGNSDVDNGTTTLTSPTIDFTGGGTISWFYWLDDSAGAAMDSGDGLFVELSTNNGASWDRIRTYTTPAQSWRTDSVEIPSVLASSTYRIRFIAADVNGGSLVEAAVDGIDLSSSFCVDPKNDCIADFNDDTMVNVFDILDFLGAWNAQGPGSDVTGDGMVNVFDILAFLDLWNSGCP